MLESDQILADDDPSKTFLGVRYILLGFDSVKKEKIQSKLFDGGGIDALNYGPGCTHVIVDKLVYDDPMCVTARRDSKALVTSLWVDHSFDVGMRVDHSSIMYRPVRDFNGILGAKSMVVCLTGYQRQDRDDIMTMVGLMGASFSKPLVANKVTHLICYKFEGEKYELAMKIKTIKLVNHRWLEDCLKAWEILPETDYTKSGYELEMEAEAKDSEDETEDMAPIIDAGRKNVMTPQNAKAENKISYQSSLKQEISRNTLYSSASKHLGIFDDNSKVQSTPRKETDPEKPSFSRDNYRQHETPRSFGRVSSKTPLNMLDGTMINERAEKLLSSASESAKKSPRTDVSRKSCGSLLRSTPRKPSLSPSSERIAGNFKVQLTPRKESGPEKASFLQDKHEISKNSLYSSASKHLFDNNGNSNVQSTPEKASFLQDNYRQNEPPRSSVKFSSKTPSGMLDGEMIYERAENLFPCASESAKKKSPRSDVFKRSSRSFLRSTPRKPSLSPSSQRIEAGNSKLPLVSHQDGTDFHGVITPLKGTITNMQLDEGKTAPLSDKRKKTLSLGSAKLQKVSNDYKTSVESKPAVKTKEVLLASEFSSDGSSGKAGNTPPMIGKHHLNGETSLVPIVEGSEIGVVSNNDGQECNQLVLKSYQKGSKKRTSSTNLEADNHSLNRTSNNDREVEMHESGDKQSIESPFLNTSITGDGISDQPSDLDISKLENTAVPHKRKMFAKKTLGSRPSIGKGRTAANSKGSIGLKKATVETISISNDDKVMVANADRNRSKTNKLDESHQEAAIDEDETEAPDDKADDEFDGTIYKDKFAEVEAPDICNLSSDEGVGLDDIGKQSTGKNTKGTKLNMKNSVEKEKNDTEAEKVRPSKKTELAESKSTGGAKGKILPKAKKRPSTKTKKKVNEPEEASKREENKTVADNEDTVVLADKAETRPSKKLKCSTDAEKENKPVTVAHQSLSSDTRATKKATSKKANKSTSKSLKVDRGDSVSIKNVHDHGVKNEPACFILSGHKLQRKEFQQVIKRLKGKVCRDSHNWSYQATHFIVPDPIRRTEKFFAAAASGSWILKTDYLTASNEAGKFLSEEPYEWHKKGLSEDGAINLEAPRKWRLMREKTGHGAFYGMRIVIYGECIAPPLDTLKRVIKAGEGTILATSPPYTRFFQSRIDFAIVSPSMPRVDLWVQEFLRHEVPCVLADYLVEYVCKPNYSLERHVQYNTHSWADKSLVCLVSRVEEVADEEPRTPEDDVACQVCGACDRGDEMLMCGDESGTLGCGAGTHLDCLDPPLVDVPEDDWFCPPCSKKYGSRSVAKSHSKRSSKSNK